MLSILGHLLFFGAAWGCIEAGCRLRQRSGQDKPEVGALEGALFGLMGLLLAFAFSGAANRYEQRRDLILAEANAISTAYLRLDLLPSATRQSLQAQFRSYTDTRLTFYQQLADPLESDRLWRQTTSQQTQLWSTLMAAVNQQRDPATASLIPAVNEMFDLATSRHASLTFHPPAVLYLLLFLVSLVCCLLAGFAMGAPRSRLHSLSFAAVLSLTLFVISDLEHPRRGWIQLETYDTLLRDVRQSMGEK